MFKEISRTTETVSGKGNLTTVVEASEVVDIGVILRTVTLGVSEALLLIPEAKLSEEADGSVKILMRWR
jgi:hypothetical protein